MPCAMFAERRLTAPVFVRLILAFVGAGFTPQDSISEGFDRPTISANLQLLVNGVTSSSLKCKVMGVHNIPYVHSSSAKSSQVGLHV